MIHGQYVTLWRNPESGDVCREFWSPFFLSLLPFDVFQPRKLRFKVDATASRPSHGVPISLLGNPCKVIHAFLSGEILEKMMVMKAVRYPNL